MRQSRLGACGNKRSVDARVSFQHGAKVTVLPAGAAFDAEHVDLFIHDPDAALDPVVRRGGLVGERLDSYLDLSRTFFMHVDVEEDLLELQAALERYVFPGNPSAVEEDGQVSRPFFVALGLELDADRNFVAGEGDFLHDDIADGDVVRIGNSHRHGIDRNPASAEVMHRGFCPARRSIQSIGKKNDPCQGRAAFRFGYRFERLRDRCSSLIGLQRGQSLGAAVLAVAQPVQSLAERIVADVNIAADGVEYRPRRLRQQTPGQV